MADTQTEAPLSYGIPMGMHSALRRMHTLFAAIEGLAGGDYGGDYGDIIKELAFLGEAIAQGQLEKN